MEVSIIVAVDKNNCIGKGNEIPWHLPADLKYFKEVTTPNHVIMGRKCFESIPEKFRPLPNRVNIVITRQEHYKAKGAIVVHSLEEAFVIAEMNGEEEAFVIGGGEIYKLAMSKASALYVTRVETEVEDGEIYFPEIDFANWQLVFSDKHQKDEKNKFDYTFEIYDRIIPSKELSKA